MSDRASDVFHYDGLDYWGPMGTAKMEQVMGYLRLGRGDRVLDIGCGKAELLLRLVERYGVEAVGVDRSSAALAQARAAADVRAPDARIQLIETEVSEYHPGGDRFAAIAWLGGPFVGGDFASTLSSLAEWLRPGGSLLIGHGFWQQPPPPDYLAATGIPADELTDHRGNIARGQQAGLRLTFCCTSTRDEWDVFEGTILHNVEGYAADHPDAPDPDGRLDQRRSWNDAQQRWGRDTMGFGLYVFRAPR